MTDTPNVLWYVSDSLRADHLSSYGYNRETTPHIDQLAADGIRFDRMFAQAYKTVESSVSMLTGLYPPTHRARTTYDSIPAAAPSLPAVLSAAGYRTAGFSSLVQLSKRRGFDRGFDCFEELFRSYNTPGVTDWAAVCSDRAIEWLKRQDDAPFFLFVWSNGTHDPYAPRAGVFSESNNHPVDGSLDSLRNAGPEDAERVRNLYDDTIRHADAEFGRLLKHLRETGRYEETAVICTADHGELLSEHGRLEHAFPTAQRTLSWLAPDITRSQTLFEPGAFVGHLGTLPYEELLHVPAIIKPPGGGPGENRTGLTETIDLAATIADLCRVEFDSQGRSLRPLLAVDQPFKEYVFSDTAISRGLTQLQSVRSADHKLIRTAWSTDRLRSQNALEAKHALLSVLQRTLVADQLLFEIPEESTDVGTQQPDRRTALAAELDRWLQECTNRELESQRSELDAETKRQLQELGYMS